jgi:hypothetical protein
MGAAMLRCGTLSHIDAVPLEPGPLEPRAPERAEERR